VQATARAEQDTGSAAGYPRFHTAVALAQLTSWLPGGRRFLIDISGPGARAAEVAACAGHSVLRVIDQKMPAPPPVAAYEASGRLCTVAADGTGLEFLPDGCADGVIAEERTLSLRLAAEELVAEIARVLRPGGQVLACVDSLTFGMALLAEQHRWPHLVDVPNADVVLIPWPDGTITRCYGAEQLRELFTSGGLEVSWIRPRTVLSPQTVAYLLARDPASFGDLVNAELHARSDDSVGAQLIACAVKRGGTSSTSRGGTTPLHPPAREGAAPRSPPAGGTAENTAPPRCGCC
jgi:SAM-dependent methyltransferase